MYTVAAPARCASVPATVYIWVYGRGPPPPSRVHYFQIYGSVAICGLYVVCAHKPSDVATLCGQLLVLTILLRGETSTQVIRFVLIHTFNIAHN